MKYTKYSLIGLVLSGLILFAPTIAVEAQSMTTTQDVTTSSTSNSSGDQKGQDIYNQLQNKQTSCGKLTDDNFAALGDFFMGRMMGSAHETMDQYMTQNLGTAGDRQTHIAIGERLSGCNTNASYPDSASNYAPMAWTGMMGTSGSDWNMMGYGNSSWSGSGMTLSALFVIAAIAGLSVWLYRRGRTATSSLDTIKLRYAKGEITKNEYEQLRHGLTGK
jgi:uncharacterized membrane protein